VQKINSLKDRSMETKEKWEKEIESIQGDLDTAKGIVNQISNIKTADLTDVTNIRGTIDEITGAYETVNGLTDRVGEINDNIKADVQLITSEVNTVLDGITNDYDYLKDFISLPAGEKLSFVTDIAERYLNERFGKIYGYAQKGLKIVKNLGSKDDEAKAARRGGRMVIFPGDELPEVLIREITLSSSAETGIDMSGQLRDITNDQELLGKPLGFTVDARDLPGAVSVDGIADTRETAETALGIDLGLSDFPFDAGDSLSSVSISSLTGGVSGDITLNLSTLTDGAGSLGVVLAGTRASITADNLVMNTLEDILNDSPDIQLSCDFSMKEGAISVSNVKNNLDALISGKIGSLIDEQVAAVESRLRSEVEKYLSEYLGKAGIGGDFLDNELVAALAQARSVDDLTAILDSKKTEASDKLTDLTDQVKQRVEDEVNRVKDEAVEKVEEVKEEVEETVEEVKEEAEETVEEVKEEAEEAVKDAAEEAVDSIKDKLPSFPRKR